MPYRFDFDPANKILRGRFSGRIDDKQLKECSAQFGALAARTNARVGVVDFSSVSVSTVTAGTVRVLALAPPAMPKPSSPRFMIAPKPTVRRLAHLFHADGWQTRPNLYVVKSLLEVCVILGVYDLKFGPLQQE